MIGDVVARPHRRADATACTAVVVLGLAVGYFGSDRPRIGLVLVLLLSGLAFMAVRPVLAAVLSLPAVYGYQSLGLGPSLGLSDLMLIAGGLLALPALARAGSLRALSPLNGAFLVYLAFVTPSLIANPTAAAAQEVVHRVVIVIGAVLVGAWLVQEGRVKSALRLLVLLTVFFAIASVITWLTNGQQPAYPLGYHKNYVGSLLAFVLIIGLCLPDRLVMPTLLRVFAFGIIILGLLACQSRGAILGAALGGVIWLFAPQQGERVRGRARLAAALLAVSFSVYAGQSVQDQLTSSDVETNSVGVRRDVEAFTLELWRSSPITGVGIRYSSSGEYGRLARASNNAINNELAEAGIAGATGFVIFHSVVLALLWRLRRSALGVTALALVSGQLLHGMFDIYWSSGITPVPFIVAGMALAASYGGARTDASDREVNHRV